MCADALTRPASEQHALSLKLLGRTGVGPEAIIFDSSREARFVEALRASGYRLTSAPAPNQACCVWHDADWFAGLTPDSQRTAYMELVYGSVRLGGWALVASSPGESASLQQLLGHGFRRREVHRLRRFADPDGLLPIDFHIFERVV